MKYDEDPAMDLKDALNHAIWLNPYIKSSFPIMLIKPDEMKPNNLKMLNFSTGGYFIGTP